MNEVTVGAAPQKRTNAVFPAEELREYLKSNVAKARRAAEKLGPAQSLMASRILEIARGAESAAVILDAPGNLDLEELERRLTVLDDKVYAAVTGDASEELLMKIRREMDGQLAMYRRKMKAEQIALIERQYLQKRLLEEFVLPRFSLFYFS
jgi:hypothetical protein